MQRKKKEQLFSQWYKTANPARSEKKMPAKLGLKETVVQMAKANGVRWYGMC